MKKRKKRSKSSCSPPTHTHSHLVRISFLYLSYLNDYSTTIPSFSLPSSSPLIINYSVIPLQHNILFAMSLDSNRYTVIKLFLASLFCSYHHNFIMLSSQPVKGCSSRQPYLVVVAHQYSMCILSLTRHQHHVLVAKHGNWANPDEPPTL